MEIMFFKYIANEDKRIKNNGCIMLRAFINIIPILHISKFSI